MLISNDRKSEPREPIHPELNFFGILSHAMLCSVGIATVFFSPLPMMLSHIRLPEPWPKITALLGAVVALLLLETSVIPVVGAFAFGLFVADQVKLKQDFWLLLGKASIFALGIGSLIIFSMSQMESLSVSAFWQAHVTKMISQFKESVGPEGAQIQWDTLEAMLLFEGPFLFLAGSMLSLWVSVGIAAHFEWFDKKHPLRSSQLRKVRLPNWFSLLFVGGFIAVALSSGEEPSLFSGIIRILGVLMFIQGCVCISEVMKGRKLGSRVRTLVYSLSILLGFYAVVGMGVLSPVFYQRQKKNIKRFNRTLEEGI